MIAQNTFVTSFVIGITLVPAFVFAGSITYSVALSAKHLDITEQFKVSIIHENCASSHSGCVHGFTTFCKYPLYRLILFRSLLIVNFQIKLITPTNMYIILEHEEKNTMTFLSD